MALATKHLKETPPNIIVVAKRDDAEKLWRHIQQTWDIPPAENFHGQWLIKVPATVDMAFIFVKFLREEMNFSTLKVLDYDSYCPSCHQLYASCSCDVA